MSGNSLSSFTKSRRRLLGGGVAFFLVATAVLIAVVAFTSGAGEETTVVEAESLTSRYAGDPGAIYDRPVTTPTPSPVPTPSPTPAPVPVGPPLRDAPFRMVIDRIGVNAPVNPYGLDSQRVPQVPLNAYEVAWYNFSAQPGTGGNAVFAGHVTWSGQGVFYYLDTLAPGDTIRLIGEDGTQLLYTVSESYMVDPNDPASLSVMGTTPNDVITIITCDGSFFYTGDPVFRGDYTNRRVVRATHTSTSVTAVPAGGG